MKLKVNVILFDFDGVIVNSSADIVNAVNYTLNYFGKPVLKTDEIISYVGRGMEVLLQKSFKVNDPMLIKQALPVYKNYYLEHCVIETKLYTNVKETLEFFKDKKTGLVTNKPEDLTLKILKCLDVRDYFGKIIGPESVKRMKPDPEGLIKVINAFGENPVKTIMVGDSYTDIVAGKSAGTYTCGVTYGLGSKTELIRSAPDFIVDDLLSLTSILE